MFTRKTTSFRHFSSCLLLSIVCFLVGCENQPQKQAIEVAKKVLMASAENPREIENIEVLKATPLYGSNFVTAKELDSLFNNINSICGDIITETDFFQEDSEKEKSPRLSRQLKAVSAMKSLVSFHTTKQELNDSTSHSSINAWKVRISYDTKSKTGETYRSECWFFLDKKATCVINSFEIPQIEPLSQ